jgi:threonine dehydratase
MVTLADIRTAADRIRPIAHRTPVLTSRSFDAEAGVRVYFKCENFQRGGSFKIRGAANLIFSLPNQDVPRGVVAFSSGNHAQAVAIAARSRNMKATVVMPLDAPAMKVEATAANGADIVRYDRFRDNREAVARNITERTGAVLVPPYDDERILTGQGTAALELLEDRPGLDALIAPVGGGGLAAGCTIAARGLNPRVRVFGSEPETANDTQQSLRAGKRVEISAPDTIADGLRSPVPGIVTFPILQELLEDVVTVSEQEIRDAMRFLATRMKIMVEPSGAVPAAVVLFRKLPPGIGSIGVILSGGNMDPSMLG